jgi:glycosyltransferase involved in cell wall biosynthesis
MTRFDDQGRDLLIVSFSYRPMLNPRAFRWTALAEEFARRGVRVRVVCSWQPGLAPRETINGVEIHRVGNRFAEGRRAQLARIRGQGRAATGATVTKESNSPLGRLAGRFWRQIAWPDTTCVWYRPALHEANTLLSAAPGATVVTVSPSFTAQLIGRAIAKSRLAARWVADMGDPFSLAIESPANNFFLYGGLNRWAERAMFRTAHAVTLTNARIRREYANQYPDSSERMVVIPPLLPDIEALSDNHCALAASAGTAIRLVYVGSLYKSLRRPDFLLALFKALSKKPPSRPLELHFFGNTEECNDAFAPYADLIGGSLQLHGMVVQEKALAAMRDASLVVNLGNANPCQLPSKLVEYMAFGKPILNIIQSPADPSLELLRDYRSVLTLLTTARRPDDEQVDAAARFIHQATCCESNASDALIDQYKLGAIADQYAALLFRE